MRKLMITYTIVICSFLLGFEYFAEKENNNYNGSIIELPEEIDCAATGDTLIVIETVDLSDDERIIKIGYKR